jgi:septum site-determining protein MinC
MISAEIEQGPAHAPASTPRRAVPFDLKGTMAPLTVLRLRTTDLPAVERHLRVKIAQLPQMFLDAPVLLDMSVLGEGAAALDFADLAHRLRSCKLVPVAVAHLGDELRPRAVEAGLGVLAPPPPRGRGDGRARGATPAPSDTAPPAGDPGDGGGEQATTAAATTAGAAGRPTAAAAHATPYPAAPAPHGGPLVINQPVRSGQVVYAQNADLVILAPVNPGAQVIADGHIHVYAPLRGRAVAGRMGLLGARIFCQRLEAELVAISGAYVMAEDIPAERRGRPAQIYLEGTECRIAPL